MKDFWIHVIVILIYLAIAGVVLGLSALIIKGIVNSDLPIWVKIMLLK